MWVYISVLLGCIQLCQISSLVCTELKISNKVIDSRSFVKASNGKLPELLHANPFLIWIANSKLIQRLEDN